jgi:uncharacterized membrane protein (DUF485 family)
MAMDIFLKNKKIMIKWENHRVPGNAQFSDKRDKCFRIFTTMTMFGSYARIIVMVKFKADYLNYSIKLENV